MDECGGEEPEERGRPWLPSNSRRVEYEDDSDRRGSGSLRRGETTGTAPGIGTGEDTTEDQPPPSEETTAVTTNATEVERNGAPESTASRSIAGPAEREALVVPLAISEELTTMMTKGLTADESKAISKEFPLVFEDKDFSLKPPKLDSWLLRRIKEKGLQKTVNANEEALISAQLKIMDIAPPLVDLYARLHTLPADADGNMARRSVQAVLQQWGRAYLHITRRRREAAISITDPEAEYLLKNEEAFAAGKEARGLLFTDKFIESMLKDAQQDQTLARRDLFVEALGTVTTASATGVRGKKSHLRGPEPRPSFTSNRGNRSSATEVTRNVSGRAGGGGRGRGGRGRRGSRNNAWTQGERRYVSDCPSIESVFIKHPPGPERPVDCEPVGARLRGFASRWTEITDDHWSLMVVREGARLDFVSSPIQYSAPVAVPMSGEMMSVCDREVADLLAKRAVVEVFDGSEGFVCSLFVIPKKSGGFRPIVNLKPLNSFIRYEHFKMEGLASVRFLVRKGDWMAKLDLKDAYLTVPIYDPHQKYLRFSWGGRIFQFTCLAFGLASAPRIFTKLLKVVAGFLRKQGIRLVVYLDDILLVASSREALQRDVRVVIELFQYLGFFINWEKSEVCPSQILEYLGLVINSIELSFVLPTDKAAAVKEMCSKALAKDAVTLRTLASIQGHFAWAIPAVPFAQSHYRSLQRFYIEGQRNTDALDRECLLSPTARADLRWWVENVTSITGRCFFPSEPDLEICTDASLSGWGACCGGVTTRGPWTRSDLSRHINELELLAAYYAVQAFVSRTRGLSVRLFLDNSTAVSYINKCGGTRSLSLTKIATDLSSWCERMGISLEAIHLPGVLNVIADQESRAGTDGSDWMLDRFVFDRLNDLWRVDVDLFAAPWNSHLESFVSWKPQPGAMATNAFSLNWSELRGYAFPPFSLIFKCIDKIRREGSSIVLVCPVWIGQPWFPLLLEHSCDVPRLLGADHNLLTSPLGEPHPLLVSGALRLAAWKLSGDPTKCRDFRDLWSNFSWPATVQLRTLLTSPPGSLGVLGAWEGIKIPCQTI